MDLKLPEVWRAKFKRYVQILTILSSNISTKFATDFLFLKLRSLTQFRVRLRNLWIQDVLLLHPRRRRGSERRRRHFRGRKFTINKNRAFTKSATTKVKKQRPLRGSTVKTDRDARPKLKCKH